jgi:pimeloyl-ACP methyl ester carboxylesterase
VAIFVVAHGAWSAGWAWKKMRPLMRAAGHEFWTPTYTGVGERAHLANADIDLDTHIQDVVNVLEFEDLRDVVLVGHSYGGMVATGVADRARERIAQVIYLDAFVPEDGKSLSDYLDQNSKNARQTGGDGWRVPPMPMPPDTPQADQDWAMPRRMPQPAKTLSTPIKLSGQPLPPRSYIYCKRTAPDDRFGQFAQRAKREGWGYYELDASHNPHITTQEELAKLFDRIAKSPPD